MGSTTAGDIISPTLLNIIEWSWTMEGTMIGQDQLPWVCFYVDDGAITGMDANLVQQ